MINMGGYEDHVAIMGDWMPPSPSPRSFFSSMLNDGVVAPMSLPDPSCENESDALALEPKEQVAPQSVQQNDYVQTSVWGDEASAPKVLAESRVNSRGGLVERIAARAGFNAPRLNTENIRPADLSKNQEVRSPYLTISPGLSPTTLFDSPVFLSNSLVQPSPTTGKFSFAPRANNLNSVLGTDDDDKGKENTFEDTNASPFAFRTVAESVSFPSFNPANRVNPSGFAAQSFPRVVGVSVHSDTSFLHQSNQSSKIHAEGSSALFQETNFTNSNLEDDKSSNLLAEQNYNSVGFTEPSPPLDEQNEDDGDQRDLDISGGPAEDGYNWRKYGQKQVKGSDYPRSYYKCTHPNCPVKKKVERSQEGHVTEIIYKGAHNHPKPPPNRRSAQGSSNALGSMQLDSEQPDTGANNGPIWSGMQREGPGDLDSALLGQKYSNGAAILQGQNSAQYESGDGVEGSATFSNDGDDDDDDHATHGSMSLGYDGEGDESESKRRRIEAYAPEMNGPSRAIREPRVVVQTTSEVDILDDGYRWRKYGQKVVKGNPNPRSYYKCTSTGCNVRKHVERASHDLKSVITTYEGKHNHDVPAARNNGNHGASPNMHPPQPAPAPRHMQRPEPSQVHSNRAQFERPPSLGQFGMPNRPQLGPGPGFGYGMNQNGLASLVLAGLGPNQGKLPVLPVHPYLGQHQTRPMSDLGFMMPKGEPKLEPATESGLNSASGSSVYQQFMGRMPLGPQM